jgi:hypothetical protein
MATNVALFLAEGTPNPSTQSSSPAAQLLNATFDLFGGLRAVADAALVHLLVALEASQLRWPRVADILQTVVDIHYEKRAVVPGGASLSKAMDVLLGYHAVPRRSRLAQDWSDFRDVSHLIAAAAHIATWQEPRGQGSILTPVLLAPEVVFELALAFQVFGLAYKPFSQKRSLLPAETLWQVSNSNYEIRLPLPVRRLSDEDLQYLTSSRRARRKV